MKKYALVILIVAIILVAFGLYIVKAGTIGNAINKNDNYKKLTLQVNIPCPGHAGLIKYNLQELEGIENIEFRTPNYFDVYYDKNKISKEDIISINIFKQYSAKIID